MQGQQLDFPHFVLRHQIKFALLNVLYKIPTYVVQQFFPNHPLTETATTRKKGKTNQLVSYT
jgi:hypothetical protein